MKPTFAMCLAHAIKNSEPSLFSMDFTLTLFHVDVIVWTHTNTDTGAKWDSNILHWFSDGVERLWLLLLLLRMERG